MLLGGQVLEHLMVEHDGEHRRSPCHRRERAIEVAAPPAEPVAAPVDCGRRNQHQVKGLDREWAERFAGRTMTAFERKGIAKGREIRDLSYRRLPR